MQCTVCAKPAAIYQRYSGRHLCAEHLSSDIESRAKRVIRQQAWLVKGDKIGVFPHMPHGEALCFFLKGLIGRRTDITLIRVEEDLPPMDGSTSWYSTFTEVAKGAQVTRIALPDTVEDIAVRNLSSLLRGDTKSLLSSTVTGLSLPWMQPFREISGAELDIYSHHHHLPIHALSLQIQNNDPRLNAVRELLAEYTRSHPSAPHALRRYGDHLAGLAAEK
jgi:hypothetical protein